MTGLDVIYVNYNSTELLLESVASLERAARGRIELDKVVVFDNASRPEHQHRLAKLGDHIEVVRSPENLGFAVACNRGARLGRAPNLLFLNPDTLVLDDMLGILLHTLHEHGGRALLGPRHFADPRQELSISPLRGTSLGGGLADAVYARGYSSSSSFKLLRRRISTWERAEPTPVRAVSGAAMMIGRDAFGELGGFDERFFLYVEDTDLCVRARRLGIPVLYVPHANLVHLVEQSSKDSIESARAGMHSGIQAFERKHHSPLARAAVRLALRATACLPRRGQRFETPMTDPGEPFEHPDGKRWVVELGRSPLFDNCMTAFPDGASYVFPPKVWQRLAPGEYFARSAVLREDDRWHEAELRRWVRTS